MCVTWCNLVGGWLHWQTLAEFSVLCPSVARAKLASGTFENEPSGFMSHVNHNGKEDAIL